MLTDFTLRPFGSRIGIIRYKPADMKFLNGLLNRYKKVAR